jgi:hypothetical protein
MPVVRKLAPEEVKTIERRPVGQRKLTEQQYDAFLAEYDVGDYGEAELEPGENRLTVRNRFKAAATRRGVALDFKRTTGNMLRFKVVPADHAPAAGNGRALAASAPRKGRGRKPATA